MHISCHLDSENLQMRDCISGTIRVDQCNMAIKDISVGIVQNESISEDCCWESCVDMHGETRSLRSGTVIWWIVELVRDTIEIATGDCPRKKDIQFVFYPNTDGLTNDFSSSDMQLSFSFRVKVRFENQFFCIKYIPVHFTWWCVCCMLSIVHRKKRGSVCNKEINKWSEKEHQCLEMKEWRKRNSLLSLPSCV